MLNNLQAVVWAVVQLCKEAPLVKRRLEIKISKNDCDTAVEFKRQLRILSASSESNHVTY